MILEDVNAEFYGRVHLGTTDLDGRITSNYVRESGNGYGQFHNRLCDDRRDKTPYSTK
jgi:hypothetical protein